MNKMLLQRYVRPYKERSRVPSEGLGMQGGGGGAIGGIFAMSAQQGFNISELL